MWEDCPKCGAKLEPEAERCGACGALLFEEANGADDEAPAEDVVYTDLVPVASGSWTEILALRGALGARGLKTYIVDENMKQVDPFYLGGNAFVVTLRAPAASKEAIDAAIAALRAEARETTAEADGGAPLR